jgi:RimJ/RimL family protein N-acetyltransferase
LKLIFGQDEAVAKWVGSHIPHMGAALLKDFSAIGVLDAENRPVAGVIYHDFIRDYGTIQISMAATTPRWAQRGTIRALLHYPFEQLGCNKVWTATPHTNERAIRFNRGLGFRQEGVLRHQFGRGVHAVVCGLLRNEYRMLFLKEPRSGQKVVKSAAAA